MAEWIEIWEKEGLNVIDAGLRLRWRSGLKSIKLIEIVSGDLSPLAMAEWIEIPVLTVPFPALASPLAMAEWIEIVFDPLV